MSKTSDRAEVLSLAIARHFEKEPKFNDCGDLRVKSLDGFWIGREAGYSYTSEWDAIREPRSVTEPEIAMKLLKELLAKDFSVRGSFMTVDGARFLFAYRIMDWDGDCFVTEKELSLAIAEAVVKAFNLEVG